MLLFFTHYYKDRERRVSQILFTIKVIRQERWAGTMQRSFYVGDALTEADICAKLEHGVLSLNIPKKEEKKLPEIKVIMIEG